MKKIIFIIITIIAFSSFSACAQKNLTFDDISYLKTSGYEYTINSINGTTFILYGGRESMDVPDIGTVFYTSEKTTYSYTLKDNNIIVVDDTQYSYHHIGRI